MNVIPEAPGALPILGHTVPIVRERFGFLDSLPAVGDLVLVRLGPVRTIVVVCDPGLTRQVLRDDHTFDKTGQYYEQLRRLFGVGLVTAPHARTVNSGS